MQRMLVPAVVAITHALMIALWAAGRDGFSVPPRDPTSIVDEMAGYAAWPWMHTAAALLLIIAAWVGKPHRVAWTTGWLASAAVMGSWGWLTLIWGLDTAPGVSLVGPVLAICAAATTAAVYVEREMRPDSTESRRRATPHGDSSHGPDRRSDASLDRAGHVASHPER